MTDEKRPRWLVPLVVGVAIVAVALTLVVQWAGGQAYEAAALRVRERVALFSVGQGRLPAGVLTEIREHHTLPVADSLAMTYAESHGNPAAVSPMGAIGANQIMPEVAKRYGFKPSEMLDPVKNEHVKQLHFAAMLMTFRSNQTNALMAWSCGPAECRRQLNAKTMPTETRQLIGRWTAVRRRLVRWIENGYLSLE